MAVVEKEYLEKVVVVAEGATISIVDYIEGDFKVYRSSNDLIFIGVESGERVRFTDLITLSLGENPVKILDKDGKVIDYLSNDLEFEGTVEVLEASGLGLSFSHGAIGGTLNYGALLGYLSQDAFAAKGSMRYSGSSPYEEPVSQSSVISSAANLVADEDKYDAPVTSQLVKSNPNANLGYELLSSAKTDYGRFQLNNDGSYQYQLDDSRKVQALKQNEQVVETMRVKVFDRDTGEESIQDIDVTIIGRNDAPEVDFSASDLTATARAVSIPDFGSMTRANPMMNPSSVVTGNISVNDIDGDLIYSEVSSAPLYGTLTLDGSQWIFQVNPTHSAVAALGEGEIIRDKALVLFKDSYGGETFITLSLTIEGVQDAPVITSQSILTGNVYEDVSTGISASGVVYGDDKDVNDTLTFALVEPEKTGEYGVITLNPDGTWIYHVDNKNSKVNALNDGEMLVETFKVYVTDGKDNSDPVTIRVVIHGTDDVPEMDAVILNIKEHDVELLGTVAKEATPADHTFHVVNSGAYGYFELKADGSYVYKLNSSHYMVDSLADGEILLDYVTVEIRSPNGQTSQAQVTIRITGENDAPTIDSSTTRATGIVEEDSAIDMVEGVIVGSDVDRGDELIYVFKDTDKTGEVKSSYGTFILNADGTWSYTLDNTNKAVQALGKGGDLKDKITVLVKDPSGEVAEKEIVVTIKGNDEAPYIDKEAEGNLTFSVTEDARKADEDYDVKGKLTDVVVDPEGGNMTFKALDSSEYGTLNLNPDGNYTYVLNNNSNKVQALAEGEVVEETISIVVTDEGGNQLQTTITIKITGQNDAPVIDVGKTAEVATIIEEDTAPATGTIVATDVDEGDELTYKLKGDTDEDGVIKGDYGTLTLDEYGRWTYVLDNSNQKVQDLNANSDPLTDVITVIITDKSGASVEQQVTITIKGSDEKPYIDQGAAGSHVIDATEDVHNDKDNTVKGTLKDYIVDPESKPLEFKLMAGSQYGELILNKDGSYEFKLDNSLTIVQEISAGQVVTEVVPIMVEDDAGNVLSTTITIRITGTNDQPNVDVGSTISTGTAVEDNNSLVTIGKIVGVDVDQADVLTYELKDAAKGKKEVEGTYGKIILNADGTWEYILDHSKKAVQDLSSGDNREDRFTVVIKDGNGGTKETDIVIDVLGTNEGPIPNVNGDGSSFIKATEDVHSDTNPVTGNLTNDITSPDGDTLSFRLLADSAYGTLTVNSDGTYSFVLNNSLNVVQSLSKGQKVTESLPILVSDGTNELNTTITIEITGANDKPTINVGSTIATGTAVEDNAAPVTGKVVGQDIDQNDKLSYALDGDTDEDGKVTGTYGELILSADGTWEYKLDHSKVQSLNEGDEQRDSFKVIVNDGNGGTVEQAVVVTILGTNEAPILDIKPNGKDTISVVEDATEAVKGDMNDYVKDPEGGKLQFALQGSSDYGTLNLNGDGSYTYVIDNSLTRVQELAAGQVIVETIPILVTDEAGNQLNTYIKVKITGQNDAPTIDVGATNAKATLVEDNTLEASGKVIGADIDNGAKLAYSVESPTTNKAKYGTFTIDASTGEWTYTLNNEHKDVQALNAKSTPLTDTITVTVSDGKGGTVTKDVVITIKGDDEKPYIDQDAAGDLIFAVTEDATAPVTGKLTSVIIDPEGGALVFQALGSSSYGTLTINVDGTYSYTLNNNLNSVQSLYKDEVREETIPILVTDEAGNQLNTTITIKITGTNDAPVINIDGTDAKGTLVEDDILEVSGKVRATDVDAGDSLAYSVESPTTNKAKYGTFTIDASTGEWTYTLNNEHKDVQALNAKSTPLTDTITVTVSDGKGGTVTKDVVVTIKGSDEKPYIDQTAAGDLTFGVTEDATAEVTGTLTNAIKDPEGGNLAFQALGSSSYGTLKINADGTYSYTLNNNLDSVQSLYKDEVREETIPILVTDEAGNQLNTTITIKITGKNDAPTIDIGATDATDLVVEDSFMRIATGKVIGKDVDAGDQEKLKYTLEKIDDGSGNNTNVGKYGRFIIDEKTGAWTYILNNEHKDVQALNANDDPIYDTITVTVSDGNGGTATQVVTVTIMGQDEPNSPPEVTGGTVGAVTEDASPNTATGTVAFKDVDGDSVSFSAVGRPAYGDFVIDASTGAWTYTLNNSNTSVNELSKGEILKDYVTVELNDGNGGTVKKNVEITITGANDAPEFTALTDVDENMLNTANTASGSVVVSDVDKKDSHSYKLVDADGAASSAGQYGTFKIDENGKWTYTLNKDNTSVSSLPGGTTLTDTITVQVSDGTATIEKAITVTISGTNTAPTIDGGDTGTMTESGVVNQSNDLTGKILASDNEGNKLTYKLVDTDGSEVTVLVGKYGTLTISATGSWTYTLNNKHADVDALTENDAPLRESFDYRVNDGLASAEGQINITIKGANDRPIISGSSENITGSVLNDASVVKAEGTIVASDVDTGDRFAFSLSSDGVFGNDITFAGVVTSVNDANGYGTFTITSSGQWAYTLKQPLHADIKALGAGKTLDVKFYAKAIDEAGNALSNNQSIITITINGSNDKPVLSQATSTGTVHEDPDASAGEKQTVSDTITSTDVDTGAGVNYTLSTSETGFTGNAHSYNNPTQEVADANGYGKLTINKDGTWTYTLDPSSAKYGEIEALAEGSTKTLDFYVKAVDEHGALSDNVTKITVTIQGDNDAPTVNVGGSYTADVKEAAASDTISRTAEGEVTFSDVDTADTLTYSIRYTDASGAEKTISVADIDPVNGLQTQYGTVTYNTTTGKWTYVADDGASNSRVKGLDKGEVARDDFTVVATDKEGASAEQKIIVKVTGENEAPIISVTGSEDTIKWSDNNAPAKATPDNDANVINAYINEATDAGHISGTIVANDSNLTDGEAGANDGAGNDVLTYSLDGATPIKVTYPDGTSKTYNSIENFNSNNIYGATLTLDSKTGQWTFVTNRTNEHFLALKFEQFVNIEIGVKVEDGQGGSDNTKINVQIEGGQQDLNYIHEYGPSNILEWIQLEVPAEIAGGRKIDYNEDGLGKSASIKTLELPDGTPGWSLTTGAGTWTLTHTDGYSVTIQANGNASFSGNIPKGTIVDIPINVTVADGSVERKFSGTKLIATDHQEDGSFFTSDGSNEKTVVMDYQTFITDGTTSSNEGSASSENLANATISAKNGGRTYLHIFGNSSSSGSSPANVNNTINVATTSGATAAAITVAGLNSFLFLEVRADNPSSTGAGQDTINLGKGTVASGTKGVDIELEGGNSKLHGNTQNTITMDEWSFAGQYNYVSIIGDSTKDPNGTYSSNITLNNNITVKNQSFTAGESYFKAIGAGVYENGANFTGNFNSASSAIMNFNTFTSSGDAKVNVFLASTMVGSIDRGTSALSLIKSNVKGEAIIAKGNSIAEYSIAPIYGDIVFGTLSSAGTSSAPVRTMYALNELTINSIKTLDKSDLTVSISGVNVGNLTSNNSQNVMNTITIKEVAAAGQILNFNLSGMVTGNIEGRHALNANPLDSRDEAYIYDQVTIQNISVAQNSTLNFNAFGVAGGSVKNWSGSNSNYADYTYSFANIAGTANINIATFGGDIYNFSTDYPLVVTLGGLTTSNNAKLDMNVAVDALGWATHHDSNDGTILMNGHFDLTGIISDDPTNQYGIEIALSSMYTHVSYTDNGTTSFGLDKGFQAPHGRGQTSAGGTIETLSAEDFIIYGDSKVFDGVLDAHATTRAAQYGYTTVAASSLGVNGNVTVYGDFKTLEGSRDVGAAGTWRDAIVLGLGDDVVYSDFEDVSKFTGRITGNSQDTIYLGGGSDIGYAGVGTETWYGDHTAPINTGVNATVHDGQRVDQSKATDKDIIYLKGNWSAWKDDTASIYHLENSTQRNVIIQDNDSATGVTYTPGMTSITINGFEEIHFDDTSFSWNGNAWSEII